MACNNFYYTNIEFFKDFNEIYAFLKIFIKI